MFDCPGCPLHCKGFPLDIKFSASVVAIQNSCDFTINSVDHLSFPSNRFEDAFRTTLRSVYCLVNEGLTKNAKIKRNRCNPDNLLAWVSCPIGALDRWVLKANLIARIPKRFHKRQEINRPCGSSRRSRLYKQTRHYAYNKSLSNAVGKSSLQQAQ